MVWWGWCSGCCGGDGVVGCWLGRMCEVGCGVVGCGGVGLWVRWKSVKLLVQGQDF